MKKFLKLLGLSIAAFIAVCIALVVTLWLALGPNQPSDTKLERQFTRHRTDFDRLVQMMDEDWQMGRIAPDFTWKQDNIGWPRPEPEWGISKDRWDDYRKVFRTVGAKDGITRREKSSDIIIDVWSWGIVPSGISVGYLHCGQPHNGYLHTEEPCTEDRGSGSGTYPQSSSVRYRYKKIEQGWYIFEESW